MKNIRVFLYENFQLLDMKFSIIYSYLNRCVFVMSAEHTYANRTIAMSDKMMRKKQSRYRTKINK